MTSASLWFTVLSLSASALNFLYYPVIARLLGLAQFGDVQVGVAFIMQAAALFSSLNLVALYLSSRKTGTENITARLERVLILPSIIGACLVVALAYPISHTLQLHDPSLLYLLAVVFIINIPASTWIGTLQGEDNFIRSGWVAVISSTIKIVVSTALILAGLGAHGALLGILIGTVCVIPLTYLMHTSGSLNLWETFRLPTRSDLAFIAKQPVISYLLVSFLLLALLSTLDTLFAKIHLSPVVAGVFAQMSIIAKIPYFVSLPISILLFRHFIAHSSGHARLVLMYSSMVAAGSSLMILCLPLGVNILFGFDPSSNQLLVGGLLLVAFGAFSITNALVYLLVARGKVRQTLAVATFGFILITLLLLASSASSEDIATRYAIGQAVTAVVALLALRYTK